MRNKLHVSDSVWSSRDTSLRCVRVYGNQSVSYCVYLGEYYHVCGCMETIMCHTVFIWVNTIVCAGVWKPDCVILCLSGCISYCHTVFMFAGL